jgi:hypothetical protein
MLTRIADGTFIAAFFYPPRKNVGVAYQHAGEESNKATKVTFPVIVDQSCPYLKAGYSLRFGSGINHQPKNIMTR